MLAAVVFVEDIVVVIAKQCLVGWCRGIDYQEHEQDCTEPFGKI